MKIKVAGIDPSLRNFGLVKGFIDLSDDNLPFTIEKMCLVESNSERKKNKQVRVNSDDLRRARILQTNTMEFTSDCNLLFIEIPVGSQSARSMASYGISIGVLSSLKKPIIQVTPKEVKLAMVGSPTATKEEMINQAVALYPDANWLRIKRKGGSVITAKNEHLADAVGAVFAGILTDQFAHAMSFYNA